MVSAALLAREEVRDTQRRVEIRQRLHDRFAHALDGLEARVKASQPTLAALTQAIFALQQEVTQALPEGLVEEAHRALGEQRTAACRRCGQTVSAGGPGASRPGPSAPGGWGRGGKPKGAGAT